MPSRARIKYGLELRDHGQHVEQQPPDRIGRIVHGRAERELDPTGGELVGDRARVGQRPRQPIELRDHQRVTGAARRQRLPQPRPVTMLRLDVELKQGDGRRAGSADRRAACREPIPGVRIRSLGSEGPAHHVRELPRVGRS
jgi:hypothetical protein